MSSSPASSSRPLRLIDYFTLNVYWFALSFLWNSMGPILLPVVVALLVPQAQKGSALGLISAIGLIVAVVVQPAAGAWTDNHGTRWGKRRPYIFGGTLFDVIFLIGMAFAPGYGWLLIAYVLLQTSSNVAHGPYQGYIPELVPEGKRGSVTGVKQFLEITGIIVTSLVTGYLVGQGKIAWAFGAIILVLLASMLLTIIFVSERPFLGAPQASTAPSAPSSGGTGLSASLRAVFHSRDFFLWLISRLLILLGANLVRNYALYFLQDVLHSSNPAGEVSYLMAIIAVAIALVAYPAGWLSDRIGRKGLNLVSGILGILGALLMTQATRLVLVLVFGGVIGVSIGIFLSVNWAWAADLLPSQEGGRYLGVSNLATAGSGVLAGAGGFLLDALRPQSAQLAYSVLFLIAALCYALGSALMLPVRDTRPNRN